VTDTQSATERPTRTERADVVVVGAGPGGSATAAYLADHGVDVILLEKSSFPRDKICGDGLTPRATKELISLGVDTTGWQRTKGLRIKGGGHTLQLDWPQTETFPDYGMVRTRMQLDEELARHAERRGALLVERTSVTGPLRDTSGRVTGVSAKRLDDRGRPTGELVDYRAPVVIASDGVSSRLATAVGREKREEYGGERSEARSGMAHVVFLIGRHRVAVNPFRPSPDGRPQGAVGLAPRPAAS